MAKGAKKDKGAALPTLPNRWVKVTAVRGDTRCQRCGKPLGRGMRWVDGSLQACATCGKAIARGAA